MTMRAAAPERPAGDPVSLYIHYPFCVRKCRYCDFLSFPADEEARGRYLAALEREIRAKAGWLSGAAAGPGQPITVDTVYIGGGTPSLMTSGQLEHLMDVLSSCFLIDEDAEITMECNPGTVDYTSLRSFRGSGVNRLSVGVQSFRDDELRLLGRIHTAQEARACIADARRAGFANLSLDLISALPGQTYGQWMDNLSEAVRLEPEHLSAYGLILEDGTPLKEAYEASRRGHQTQGRDARAGAEDGAHPEILRETMAGEVSPLPDEETDRRMYHDTGRFLERYGYHRYEISNYARRGFESRHNSGYWTGHPYLGLGLGASSFLVVPARQGEREKRIRQRNTGNMVCYLKACLDDSGADPAGRQMTEDAGGIIREREVLSTEDQMAEFMFLGLRRMCGVSEQEFERRFDVSMDSVYGTVLCRYRELGLLQRKDGRVALTEHGIDVSNTVMADFLPD